MCFIKSTALSMSTLSPKAKSREDTIILEKKPVPIAL